MSVFIYYGDEIVKQGEHIKFDNTNIGRAAMSGKLYHGLFFEYA